MLIGCDKIFGFVCLRRTLDQRVDGDHNRILQSAVLSIKEKGRNTRGVYERSKKDLSAHRGISRCVTVLMDY